MLRDLSKSMFQKTSEVSFYLPYWINNSSLVQAANIAVLFRRIGQSKSFKNWEEIILPESLKVFGIKFVRDEFIDEDRYLSKDGGATSDLGNAWFNLDLDHANWYARRKSKNNSAMESSPFSFQITEDGEPISE